MTKNSIKYGLLLALALITFKALEYSYFSYKITLDMYLAIVSLIFLFVGSLVGLRLNNKKKKLNQKNYSITSQSNELLSDRELEVLLLMAQGHTNQQIADQLFVSINTTKTHLSNIYSKLNVENRTQAVSEAKKLNIISH